MEDAPRPLYLRIIEILRQHHGRDRIISSAQIARELGLPQRDATRQIRALITDCRLDGTFEEFEMPVVAVPGAGYFIASSVEEFHAYDGLLAKLQASLSELRHSFARTAEASGIRLTTTH